MDGLRKGSVMDKYLISQLGLQGVSPDIIPQVIDVVLVITVLRAVSTRPCVPQELTNHLTGQRTSPTVWTAWLGSIVTIAVSTNRKGNVIPVG